MPTDEEKIEQLEQDLKDEAAQTEALEKRADRLAHQVRPDEPDIDHAKDGGVI